MNNILHPINTVQDHLFVSGFMEGYTCWTTHGEDAVMGEGNNPGGKIQNSEPGHTDIEFNRMGEMETPQQNADCENPNRSEQNRDCEMPSYDDDDDDMPDFDAMLGDFEGAHVPGEYKAMATLKVDAKTDLYPGCKKKYSKLSATLIFLRYKAKYGVPNKGMTELLTILQDMFPDNNVLPVTNNEAMKVVCPLSLEVQKIHACVNDCMLYDSPDKDLCECRICHHP